MVATFDAGQVPDTSVNGGAPSTVVEQLKNRAIRPALGEHVKFSHTLTDADSCEP